MAYEIRSISQVGTSEPFELQLARGQIPGHSFVHRMGRVRSMSQNQTGTVWDVNDTVYPWSAWDTVGTISIARANAADAGKNVIIQGLDADFNFIEETITLTAASGNVSVNTYTRLAFIRMNGTSANVGAVTVTKGAVVVGYIAAGVGQSVMGVYTVPAGYNAFLTKGVMTIESGADATGIFYYRLPGDRFVIGHTFEVAGSEYSYEFTAPLALPEKTDIDVQAAVRSNNAVVTAAFDIILIKQAGPL